MPAGQPVDSHHLVLELGTLGPLQRLRVIHKQGPRGVLSRGDYSQGTAVGVGELQLVLHMDATELLAVFHADFPNLGVGHRGCLSWVAGLPGMVAGGTSWQPESQDSFLLSPGMVAPSTSLPSMSLEPAEPSCSPGHHTTAHPAAGREGERTRSTGFGCMAGPQRGAGSPGSSLTCSLIQTQRLPGCSPLPSLPAWPVLLWGPPLPIFSACGWGGPLPARATHQLVRAWHPACRIAHKGPNGPSWDLGWTPQKRGNASPRVARLTVAITGAWTWAINSIFFSFFLVKPWAYGNSWASDRIWAGSVTYTTGKVDFNPRCWAGDRT